MRGGAADAVSAMLTKIPLRTRLRVKTVTTDLSSAMMLIVRNCFPGASLVNDRFHVQHIAYNPNREITELRIVNGRGQTVYELKQKMKQHSALSVYMEELKRELARTGVTMEAVLERYALKEPGEMTEEIYKKALRSLKKTRTKEAA